MANLADAAADLRTGITLWEAENPLLHRSPGLAGDILTDILIIGAGITGAFLAERLTRLGRQVFVVDRRGPAHGSTAASTALLQWELDSPMLAVEDRYGFESAARIFRRTRQTVAEIADIVGKLGIDCAFRHRDSLYLAGTVLDPVALRDELGIRHAAGIDGHFCGENELFARQGIRAAAALHHSGSAEVDPVALARGLLAVARARGARIAAPVTALAYDRGAHGIAVTTDSGHVIRARALLLATGYEMPGFVPATAHQVVSTFALATAPLPPGRLWPTRALVWEASDPYLYFRTTADNRIVAGGEDEETTDAAVRDRLIPEKTATVLAKLGARVPDARGVDAEFAWSGFFGQTVDGLPLIGRIPGAPGCYAAYGYGGNGITFSCLAAGMIGRLIMGERDPDEALLAVEREP